MVAIPSKSEELAELLANQDAVMEVIRAGEFQGLLDAYVAASDPREELKNEVAEHTKQVLNDWMAEQGVKRPALSAAAPEQARMSSHAPTSPTALGAELDGRFTGFGDFARAIWHRNLAVNGADARFKVRNDLSGVIGADGGFLVPESLRAELLRNALETAIVRPRARVIPMDSLSVPFPVLRDTTHASSVHGGIIGYWKDESAQLTESQPTFGRVVLTAKKLTAYTEVPNELIADSIISFEAFINSAFPEAISYFEDDAFLWGDGAGEPLGVLHASNGGRITVSRSGGASTVVWEDIVGMYARMLPRSLGSAVWVCNIDTFPQLATMSLAVGTGGSAIWLNNGTQGPPMTILGRPVVFTEKAETLGTTGDVNFIDFSYYLIGDRQALSAASSPHFKFQNDQTVYRFIERVDGLPWMDYAITPRQSTNTLSPYVVLT